MSERILIIGGSSYIGSNLYEELNENHDVLFTYNTKLPQRISQKGKAVRLDITSPDCFNALEGEKFSTIIWSSQAPNYSQDLKNYQSLLEVNVLGLQKTLEFARLNSVKKFIYLSSGSIYKTPSNSAPLSEDSDITRDSFYGYSKYVGEQICEHYSSDTMQVCSLRLFTVYGPKQQNKLFPNIIQKIRLGKEIILNQKKGLVFTSIYIKDLVNIIHNLIKRDFKNNYSLFNTSSDEVLDLSLLCDIISKKIGKKSIIKNAEGAVSYLISNNEALKKLIPELKFEPVEKAIDSMLCESTCVE